MVGDLSIVIHQALDPLVHGTERVLAQHGALGLVVELEVHPVHGEVAAVGLGSPDEVAAKAWLASSAAGRTFASKISTSEATRAVRPCRWSR